MLVASCYGNRLEPIDDAVPSPPPHSVPTPAPNGDGNTVTPTPSPPVDPNAPRCAGSGITICDSFEDAAVGQSPNSTLWSVLTQNNTDTVAVDDTRAYRGKQSLHVHTGNTGYDRADIINASLFPAANNSFFGRAFMYYKGTVPQAHFNLVGGDGALSGVSNPVDERYGGQYGIFLANYYYDSQHDFWQHAGQDSNGMWVDSTPIPSDTWVCLEWQLKGDTNEMHMFLNGAEIPTLAVLQHSSDPSIADDPWNAPVFAHASIGWEIVSNADPIDAYDIWYDEVALDTQRIGCDK